MNERFHPTAIIEAGASIGEGTRVWHFCHIESDSVIGKDCSIGQNCYVGHNVTIGDGCKLQNNVSVYEGVTLGDGVFCGPSCVFTNDYTPRARYPKGRGSFVKTIVEDGASIGANATVVCGVTVGRCAMIGAGAVLTHDAPPYALMLGMPATARGFVCECGKRLRTELCCPRCKRRYTREGDGLREV